MGLSDATQSTKFTVQALIRQNPFWLDKVLPDEFCGGDSCLVLGRLEIIRKFIVPNSKGLELIIILSGLVFSGKIALYLYQVGILIESSKSAIPLARTIPQPWLVGLLPGLQ